MTHYVVCFGLSNPAYMIILYRNPHRKEEQNWGFCHGQKLYKNIIQLKYKIYILHVRLVSSGIWGFWRLKKFIGIMNHVLLLSNTQMRGASCRTCEIKEKLLEVQKINGEAFMHINSMVSSYVPFTVLKQDRHLNST